MGPKIVCPSGNPSDHSDCQFSAIWKNIVDLASFF